MFRGLLALTWLELKIFVREPLGLVASVVMPVAIFVLLGRVLAGTAPGDPDIVRSDVPIFASLLIVINAVVSIVAIVSIYREGGILRRLRATPLRPHTILGAHVLVKLLFTTITLGAMVLAGRRLYPVSVDLPVLGFAVALLFCTATILPVGFLIAGLVPTARFAQPLASIVLYPMVAISGVFVPVEDLPTAAQALARSLPLSYAVSILQGVWRGESWTAYSGDVAVLLLLSAACTALATRVFRWE